MSLASKYNCRSLRDDNKEARGTHLRENRSKPLVFIDGSIYETIVETSQGPVGLYADVHIFGKHLVLDELMVYPADGSERLFLGVRRSFAIFRKLRLLAAEEGFDEITVVSHRTGKLRPGPIMTRTRRLR